MNFRTSDPNEETKRPEELKLALDAPPFIPKSKALNNRVEEQKINRPLLKADAKPFIPKNRTVNQLPIQFSFPPMPQYTPCQIMPFYPSIGMQPITFQQIPNQYIPMSYPYSGIQMPQMPQFPQQSNRTVIPTPPMVSRTTSPIYDMDDYIPDEIEDDALVDTDLNLSVDSLEDAVPERERVVLIEINEEEGMLLTKKQIADIVEELPIAKYTCIPPIIESCSICLEQFVVGELIKIIECGHEFHIKCVDPWLVKSLKCPLCRHSLI